MNAYSTQLSKLIDQTTTTAVFHEMARLASESSPGFSIDQFEVHFKELLALYQGRYPGYQACNTPYHDLGHTLDVTLAAIRIIHGAALEGKRFSPEELQAALIAGLLHDAGYIQTRDDCFGTGAQYTRSHVERSILFARNHCERHSMEGLFPDLTQLILSTDLGQKTDQLVFRTEELRELGNILGTADLLGQMADRIYLEKLLLLYQEFLEGGVPGYTSERDMLEKTLSFYKIVQNRLENDLHGAYRFLKTHFKKRWDIDSDLYSESVRSNIDYLQKVLLAPDYRQHLRRSGITTALE